MPSFDKTLIETNYFNILAALFATILNVLQRYLDHLTPNILTSGAILCTIIVING